MDLPDLSVEHEPGSPEFLAVLRRDVPAHVLSANEDHDREYQRILAEHTDTHAHVHASTLSDEDKQGLMLTYERNLKRRVARLRTERGARIRAGFAG